MIDSTDFTLSIFTLMIDAYLRSLRNSLFAKKLTDLLFLEFDIGKQFLHHILLDFPCHLIRMFIRQLCNSYAIQKMLFSNMYLYFQCSVIDVMII